MLQIPWIYIALVILALLTVLLSVLVWRLTKAVAIRVGEKGGAQLPTRGFGLIRVLLRVFKLIRRL